MYILRVYNLSILEKKFTKGKEHQQLELLQNFRNMMYRKGKNINN